MRLDERQGPYGESALAYIKAGWPEALPIWRGGQRDKQPMVRGYHGKDGVWPDDMTSRLWAGRYKLANIALRLPRWVIGLDVDHYNEKYGGETLADLQDDLGPLPVGPVSTSREDGVSGIRLMQVPGDYVETHWPSQAGEDIEVISWYERYVICAPSVHKSGKVYRWTEYMNGRGVGVERTMKRLPKPGDLPLLPLEWCDYLASKASKDSERWNGASFDGNAAEWLLEYGAGDGCQYVQEVGPRWVYSVMNGGSAHEAAKLAVAQAIKAAAEGHVGINSALWDVRTAFIDRVGSRGTGERRRGEGKAVSEWRAMVSGAIQKWGGFIEEVDDCEELEGMLCQAITCVQSGRRTTPSSKPASVGVSLLSCGTLLIS
jgi:putative DNA primase/helicase